MIITRNNFISWYLFLVVFWFSIVQGTNTLRFSEGVRISWHLYLAVRQWQLAIVTTQHLICNSTQVTILGIIDTHSFPRKIETWYLLFRKYWLPDWMRNMFLDTWRSNFRRKCFSRDWNWVQFSHLKSIPSFVYAFAKERWYFIYTFST